MDDNVLQRIKVLEQENRNLKSATAHWEQLRKSFEKAITRLESLQTELSEKFRRLELVMDAADLGWWDWDIKSGSVNASSTRTLITGHKKETFPGNYGELISLIHKDDRDMVMHALQQHLNGEVPDFIVEYRIASSDGNWKWVYDRGRVVERDILGKPLRMTGIMIDVNNARIREIEMKEALDKAEASSRDKSLFLSGMSHEIYTPLAGVIGMADILKQSSLTAEQEEYLDVIVNSAANLMSVFNEIIDFLKIEAGRIELVSNPFSLRQMMDEVISYFMENRQEKDIEIFSFFDPNIPDKMKGDSHRIRQILHVFMDNAVKFTEAGFVTVHAWFKEWDEEFITLQFRITDTGIGIPAEGLSKIFRSFTKVESSATKKYGGSGLGLSIAHYLIREMGGNIEVESTPGSGTSFTFTIQIERYNGTGVTGDYSRCQHIRVLVIDEKSVRREILTEYLERFDCEVEEAGSLQDARSGLVDGNEKPRFDLIIADERTLGQEPIPGRTPVLWVKDQLGYSNSREASAEQAFISWPIFPDSFIAAIAGLCQRSVAVHDMQPHAGAHPHVPRRKILNILIAEDNLLNMKVALVTVGKLGHHADSAGNGIEALELFKTKSYDLVLMDIHMPLMDGLECTRKIREIEAGDPERKPVHICAITANPLKDDEEQCLKAGMNSYISKPFKLGELMAVIARV